MAKYSLNSSETIYQPDSSDSVLLNKLSIVDEAEMEALESGLLLMLYEQIFIESPPLTALNFGHIQDMASALAGKCLRLGRAVA